MRKLNHSISDEDDLGNSEDINEQLDDVEMNDELVGLHKNQDDIVIDDNQIGLQVR